MVEKPIILDHRFPIEDSIERSFNLVFKGKAIPAYFSRTVL
jgi:hypothetical protein